MKRNPEIGEIPPPTGLQPSLSCRQAGMRSTAPRWILLCLLLAGCTSQPPVDKVDTDTLWSMQQQTNQQMRKWNLKGKIGLKTGKKGSSATLKWAYSREYQEIELHGPFGGGRIHVTITPDQAVLRDTSGAVITGDTAREVLHRKLGWHVPFDELVLWSRGLPSRESRQIETDDSGRLKRLEQGIWTLEIPGYRAVGALALPRKLIMNAKPGALHIHDDKKRYLGDTLRITVVLSRWWNVSTE